MRALALACAFALVPLAAALPGSCADPCEISSDSTFGYRPVVATIATGASVVWTSTDYTHITADGRGLLDGGDRCVDVFHTPEEPSPAVRFDLVDGALVTTSDGITATCLTAQVTPAGAVLPYFCVLHPTMHGVLVVTA